MINICTKYGFDISIISDSYGGHRRRTTDAGRRTTPRVWHKLPTGELKIYLLSINALAYFKAEILSPCSET